MRVNISSREFVRGGRGRLRGSARGQGRGGHQDVYGSASRRDVESVSQLGSADDASGARVVSATAATTRSNGAEHSRPGDGRTECRQPKNEDRKLSHEALVGPTKASVKDRRNDRGTAQSPVDDQGNQPQGMSKSNARSNLAKDTGRQSEISAQTSRRRTEFYDSRNRGQRIRHSDGRANDAGKLQQLPRYSDTKLPSRDEPAKDGADAEKNVTESGQDVADMSSSRCSNEAAGEQSSQRKSGNKFDSCHLC